MYQKGQLLLFPSLLTLLAIVIGCNREFVFDEVIISSDRVLLVSAERAILLGHVHATPSSPQELGFQISTSENMSDGTMIPLESDVGIGEFILTVASLTPNTDYQARAYIVVDGEFSYGDILKFRTNVTDIIQFSPRNAPAGATVQISGANFLDGTQVFFGETEATISRRSLESRLDVLVPDNLPEDTVTISVVSGGVTQTFEEPFVLHTGVWEKVSLFPPTVQLKTPAVIEYPTEVLMGFGRALDENRNYDKFWMINKETLEWSEVPSPSGAAFVEGPISFSDGFGSGREILGLGAALHSNERWYFDQSSRSWTAGAPLPFKFYNSINADLATGTFVLGGLNDILIPIDSADNKEVWKGNDNEWSLVASVARSGNDFIEMDVEGGHFVYNDKFYYLDRSKVWEFDSEQLSWSIYRELPIGEGTRPMTARIGDKIYYGIGAGSRMLVELDLKTGIWIEKNQFPGFLSERNSAIWTHEGKIFVLRTALWPINPSDNMELWSFDPTALR